MSRTELRRWAVLGACALLLRGGLSLLTEYVSIFPPYYYHDARLAELMAQPETRASHEYDSYPLTQRAHAGLIGAAYAVWPRPLAAKLVHAALGAGAVVLFGLALRALFAPLAAFVAAALMAAWPSHAFYTSQNFKEPAVFLLFFGALALAARRRPTAAAAAACLLAASAAAYPAVAVGFAGGAALAALAALPSRRAALLAAGGAAAVLVVAMQLSGALPRIDAHRRFRQASDREYAAKFSGPTLSPGRTIGTQLAPDARVDSWSGLLAHLPKASLSVLFQPFPGLYPMEGKLGRMLAAAENVGLLALALAAAAAAARGPFTPARVGLLGFFLTLTAAAAVFEFDLGSASRHKLLYLPMLFPFAAEELLRRRSA